jgi:hypothetical protein
MTLGESIPDILAVIESAKARNGRETLQHYVAKMLPEADKRDREEAVEVALEVIESVPVFLASARQQAEDQGLSSVVNPLLDCAERYYLQPFDLIPEMTQGLPGLLDDSYLVIRILQNLGDGPEPFLDWDLDYPVRFLERLIGRSIADRLDLIAFQAMEELSLHREELWQMISHRA